MTREQLLALLSIETGPRGVYIAFLPEHPLMWAAGDTEADARADWLREYDVPQLWPAFEIVWRERAKHAPGPYHIDKWHQGMTDQELCNACNNLMSDLASATSFDEYDWGCLRTVLFFQVEMVLRRLNDSDNVERSM